LERLLWVRCRDIDQCLEATDLLLQSGGFGLLALDLSALPPPTVRYVPLNVWFRFRRAIENTSTILLLVDQELNAGSCASLVLRLGLESFRWLGPQSRKVPFSLNGCACLLAGSQIHVELVRSRLKSAGTHQFQSSTRMDEPSLVANFKTKTKWSDSRDS
jgi:hypothetical protein